MKMRPRDKPILNKYSRSSFFLPSLECPFTVLVFQGEGLLLCEAPTSYKAYYKGFSKDFLTGRTTPTDFTDWKRMLSSRKLIPAEEKNGQVTVRHFIYELGMAFQGLEEEFQSLHDETLLMIEVTYTKLTRLDFPLFPKVSKKFFSPTFAVEKPTYKEAFKKGYEHLLQGNCYQFNLTYPFDYELLSSFEDFFQQFLAQKKMHGAYAHLSHFPEMGTSYLSNSPECLFQSLAKRNNIHMWSMPIKGTISYCEGDSFRKKWRELSQSKKDQAELFMICDLLRNDLSKIERRVSHVVSKKEPLKVPGLLHQYSLVDVLLSRDIDLYRVLQGTFPGGSVTGAPKKRVMEILRDLEMRERGFYCGSSSIQIEDKHAASINIRSLKLEHKKKKCTVSAGGGVTLESSVENEYREMLMKLDSFLSLWENS